MPNGSGDRTLGDVREPAHQLLAPSVQLPFELALTHLLGFAR